jgi:hypothetical protein
LHELRKKGLLVRDFVLYILNLFASRPAGSNRLSLFVKRWNSEYMV